MFKVTVKTKNYETFKKLETMELVNSWIESDKQWWGLPDRWLKDSPLAPLSEEEKTKTTETRVVQNDLGEEVTEYFFPAEYTIEIEDITAQVEQEKANAEALAYLAETDWMVLRSIENPSKPVPKEVKEKRQLARDKVKR